jgi:hypothetical protein
LTTIGEMETRLARIHRMTSANQCTLADFALIRIGAKVVSHGHYATFQMAEAALSRQLFVGNYAADRRVRVASGDSSNVRSRDERSFG